jgi:hypothetical protein
MTWKDFFNLSTMEHRHLLLVYLTIWVVQGGYLAWIARNWLRTKSPRD